MKTILVILTAAIFVSNAHATTQPTGGDWGYRDDSDDHSGNWVYHRRQQENPDDWQPSTDHHDDDAVRAMNAVKHALDNLDHPKVCFETGDGESKSFQAAHCIEKPEPWLGISGLPITCTFDNGDEETGCFKISDGCLVCAGMD